MAKRVLLLGGGHSHLVAGPLLAAATRGRASVALVAPSPRLLYSGMMPGWLAGQYAFEDCSIDLAAVCARNGIEWIHDRIVDIDLAAGQAVGAIGRYPFDLASVNVGSDNDLGRLVRDPGENAGPVVFGAKPFAEFVDRWITWQAGCATRPGARTLLVVGGGAAAVEIALALAALAGSAPELRGSRVSLVMASGRLLPGMSRLAARIAHRSLLARGVEVRHGLRYTGAGEGAARFDSGVPIRADLVVVATGARPPGWLEAVVHRESIARAPQGGIAVRSDLRSTSHPALFAAGDCAGFIDQAVPRSGVHALRQGPVLAANLARALERGPGDRVGSTLVDVGGARNQRYTARRWTLALLNRCDGSAIGAWGPLGFSGAWAWRWKDNIDRRFIARFPGGDGQV